MLEQCLNGLVYGCLLLILASGLVLIYGLRQIVNFAHGGFYTIGAYVAFTLAPHIGFWLALCCATIVLIPIGIALDRWCFRPLENRPHLSILIVTFGLYLIIEDLVQTIWGKENYGLALPPGLSTEFVVGSFEVPLYRLFVLAVGIISAILLQGWLRGTRIGLFVRAASTNSLATAMQGVNTERLSMIVVGIGAGLAGMAGGIAAPLLTLSPTMGDGIMIDSFVVIVVGGLGSFGGAFIAAMILGQLQTFGAVYLPQLASMLPFLLMAGVLIWRPTGFAGGRHT